MEFYLVPDTITIMRKLCYLTVAAALIATTAWGQGKTPREQTILKVFGRLNLAVDPHKNIHSWTDGTATYSPLFTDISNFNAKPRANGDTIYFFGGTLHEGGWHIDVLLDAAGKMKLADNGNGYTKGDLVEYRIAGSDTLLLFKDARTGVIKNVWIKFDRNLRERLTGSLRRYILSGRYTPNKGNGNIVIALDREAITGFKGSGEKTYQFIDDYETPVPYLFFGVKEAYKATKTLTGLELAPLRPEAGNDDIDWLREGEMLVVDEKKPVILLNKAADLIPRLPAGRFPLASVEVMTLYDLRDYAGVPLAENLQVMRNEIFARHGYKFRPGGDMDGYFSTQDWYTPRYDDVTSKLTEVERINIALIQTLEKYVKEDETGWKRW